MGEAQQHRQPTASRLGVRNTGGEIVEVQGGHIVRSTGRKDRHSKVCTAKGPRDRRVRLSAHTAIQFYDVQDRLGYDRPSKAVDWLIKKAKSAIDELAELPAWKPTTGLISNVNLEQEKLQKQLQEEEEEDYQQQIGIHHNNTSVEVGPSNGQSSLRMGENTNQRQQNSDFLPSPMDSDSIADTIKSFFPMGASSETNSSAGMQFQSFPAGNHSQDLRLSLQSFQDPMLLYHHHNQQTQNQNTLFSGTTSTLGFDGSGWSENQRIVSWNAGGDTASGGGGGGGAFMFNAQPLFNGQTQFFSQRGPLQSSNSPSIRAWMDPPSTNDHNHPYHHNSLTFHQGSMSGFGVGIASAGDFTGFCIPARIQGEEEEQDGISDKPSSASSDSRH